MKVSKLLIMALVFVAVITVSTSVKAFTTVDLIAYLTSTQSVNGTTYTLSEDQKTAVRDYLTANPVSDATAEEIKNDIEAAKAKIAATGATKPSQLSQSLKSEVISMLKTAGSKAGVDVQVNLNAKTVTIVDKATGKNLVSGSTQAFSVANTGANNSASQTSGTLVYTGANSLVYVLPMLAVVAVATLIVVRKRS